MCQHRAVADAYKPVLAFMCSDKASRHLLIAYAYAMRNMMEARSESKQDRDGNMDNFRKGTHILSDRLRDSKNASSDANVQAVLLLLVYASDFGDANEAQLHINALRIMIQQRGGISSFGHNPALQQQLVELEFSKPFQLTFGCGASRKSERRFPQALWTPETRPADRDSGPIVPTCCMLTVRGGCHQRSTT